MSRGRYSAAGLFSIKRSEILSYMKICGIIGLTFFGNDGTIGFADIFCI